MIDGYRLVSTPPSQVNERSLRSCARVPDKIRRTAAILYGSTGVE